MDLQNEKCVMVIDENLPLGIIANTAAIMGITLGKQMPEVVGADVYDKTGNGHLGIIEFPVPILKGNVDVIKAIREKLYEPEFSELTVVDFSDLAQGCKTYDEFIEKMKDVSEAELNYFGIAICGAKKKVNKLTVNMDVITISSLVQHGLINRGRIFTFSVQLPDRPGELLRIADLVAKRNGNIIKLAHNQFVNINRQAGVELKVTLEAFGHAHKAEIMNALRESGYDVREVAASGTITG